MNPNDTTPSHLDLKEIAGRLREMLSALQLDATVFCEAVAVPYSTMRTYLAGKRPPSPEALAGAARVYRVSANWVLTGLGRMFETSATGEALMMGHGGDVSYHVAESPAPWRPSEPGIPYTQQLRGALLLQAGANDTHAALIPALGTEAVRPLVLSVPLGEWGGPESRIEYQVIPRRAKPAAAGSIAGPAPGSSDVFDLAGDIAFTFGWLRSNMAHTVGQLSLVQVDGTSMAPTLANGETIMIDEGIDAVSADDIYVLDLYGRRLVKRVQQLYDGTLILISDNPAYERETIPRDVARDVRVVGRMVWPRIR